MSSAGKGKGKGKEEAAAEEEEEKPPARIDRDWLEDIFLRLEAADLGRTAIACTAFRGVITDRSFRRRFARLHHPPPLVGFLETEGPAAPHPLLHPGRTLAPRPVQPRSLYHVPTPAAGAIAKFGDFACSFLPDPSSWRIRDTSGGRLLLSSRAGADLRDLMVCDPLDCTFVRVPPVPDHLIAGKNYRCALGWIPFLVPIPANYSDKEEEPPLQVVWMLQGLNTVIAFVFSSTWGWEWRPIPAFWCGMHEYPLNLSYRLCAHGCFYWTSWRFRSHTALKLDIDEMRFSAMRLPSITEGLERTNFIVEAGEGEGEGDLGVLVVGNGRLDLFCRRRQQGNEVSAVVADWLLNRRLGLPDDSLYYSIVGVSDGYMLLQAYPMLVYSRQQRRQARFFSLKLRTLVFEELLVPFNKQLVFVHLYTNFPPLLSFPGLCNKEKTGQDQRETGESSGT